MFYDLGFPLTFCCGQEALFFRLSEQACQAERSDDENGGTADPYRSLAAVMVTSGSGHEHHNDESIQR
jgi:hypothetical protein